MENLSGQRHISRNKKLITSAAVWYCTFTQGLSVSFLGASLLELSTKLETDVATTSKVFSILNFSFLAGALVCGVLFNYLNRQVVSALLLVIMGLGTASLPLAPSLILFFCIAGLVGFTGGGYDTAQLVWIIEMWQHKAAPYIQIQHFSFALGTLISPLIIKPYLSNSNQEDTMDTKLESNYTSGVNSNSTIYSTDDLSAAKGNLFIPFLIGGSASILGGLLVLLLACVMKYQKPLKDLNYPRESDKSRSRPSTTRKVCLVALSAIVQGTYCGMELWSVQFLPTFTHFIDLGLTASEGALVLSGLTGAFTIGRGIGIVVVLKIRPEILLLGNIILIVIGNSVLYLFASKSYLMLWGGSILLGIGFSTVFPSFYGYIEKHLKVSNTVGAIMITTGGAISSLYPIVIGSFIEGNPFVLMYTNYFSSVVCTLAFGMIYWGTSDKRDSGYDLGVVVKECNTENESKNSGKVVPMKELEVEKRYV